MRFYTGSMFPAEYKNAIFIARHRSWNRTKKVGGDIVVAKLNGDGTVKAIEPFLTGLLDDNQICRPADRRCGHEGWVRDQREDYLFKALRGYKSGERVGYDPAMAEVAQELSDEKCRGDRALPRTFQVRVRCRPELIG
jgi:hypothetical protein